jgi:TolB-like protein
VAVLPLRGLSDAPGQEHLAEGIRDAIAGELAKLSGLRVISRASAIGYSGTAKRASEIGRELQAMPSSKDPPPSRNRESQCAFN